MELHKETNNRARQWLTGYVRGLVSLRAVSDSLETFPDAEPEDHLGGVLTKHIAMLALVDDHDFFRGLFHDAALWCTFSPERSDEFAYQYLAPHYLRQSGGIHSSGYHWVWWTTGLIDGSVKRWDEVRTSHNDNEIIITARNARPSNIRRIETANKTWRIDLTTRTLARPAIIQIRQKDGKITLDTTHAIEVSFRPTDLDLKNRTITVMQLSKAKPGTPLKTSADEKDSERIKFKCHKPGQYAIE